MDDKPLPQDVRDRATAGITLRLVAAACFASALAVVVSYFFGATFGWATALAFAGLCAWKQGTGLLKEARENYRKSRLPADGKEGP